VNEDVVRAAAHLADRSGAKEFELGYTDDTPPRWWASITFQGTKVHTDGHPTPSGAALALSERILTGAVCRCGQPVALSDRASGCRWRLEGARWAPGCDAPPLRVEGHRGDLAAMRRALNSQEAT